MASDTDAARARVLAARTELALELERLEASARAAADIPAKVRRSPAKAAAIAGGTGFLVLGGPKRLFKRAKRAVVGPEQPLPERMLPKEIEKTLGKLGRDGDRVRGTLERDFAEYVRGAQEKRGPDLASLVSGAVAKPILTRLSKSAAEWFVRTDEEGFQAQLERLRGSRRSDGDAAAARDADSAGR